MMTLLRRKVLTFALVLMTILALATTVGNSHTAHADNSGTVFASSSTVPLLQFPEGLTSWKGKVYVATYNVNLGASNHILVFDAGTGNLLNTLGDLPGQQDLGLVYRIPQGGGDPTLVIGPAGSGAPVSDNGLLQSPVAGISPNGMTFSANYRTLYIANTWADSIVAFDVNSQGQVTGNARIFAQNKNDDLEEYPTGFTGLLQSDTQIGAAASTWLNGPDGLALDNQGDVWVASDLGDNLTELDSTGHLIATYGTSAVTASGLLNQPASLTFVGSSLYATNMSIFTGLAGQPILPFGVVSFNVGVSGAGGNGND